MEDSEHIRLRQIRRFGSRSCFGTGDHITWRRSSVSRWTTCQLVLLSRTVLLSLCHTFALCIPRDRRLDKPAIHGIDPSAQSAKQRLSRRFLLLLLERGLHRARVLPIPAVRRSRIRGRLPGFNGHRRDGTGACSSGGGGSGSGSSGSSRYCLRRSWLGRPCSRTSGSGSRRRHFCVCVVVGELDGGGSLYLYFVKGVE